MEEVGSYSLLSGQPSTVLPGKPLAHAWACACMSLLLQPEM